MRLRLFCLLGVLALPSVAWADFTLSGSVGKGLLVAPRIDQEPTTVMLAPGYALLGELLRLELGLAASLPDVSARGRFDLQVRPMVVIDPPILPLYLRVIFAAADLMQNPRLHYGGALGFGASLFGLGVFGEVGVLPRSVNSQLDWILEARAGVWYHFD